MKFIKKILFIILACCFSGTITAQYIQVNDTYTAQQLVEDVLVNSTCASISNVSVTGGDFGNGQQSFGYFDNGTSSFPFLNGVVLSTGKASSSIGPNSSILSEGSTSWTGDNDLEQALNISGSINATVLEFDFTPVTNKISFDYIFSSEQYLTNPSSNQCNYTDGFAFLLKEAGSQNQYQNLAVVPGTSTPVKINTVRGPGTVCPTANEQYFGGFNGTNHPTNYNGQTVVMTAEADVVSGTTYHIKLVIADQGNNLYDSAIFLGGGSFQSTTDLGPDRLIATNNPYCAGENVVLNATQPGINSYKWFKDGVEIIGETNATYAITDNTNASEVIYSVEIIIGTSTCTSYGEVKVEFAALPNPSNQTLVQCDDNDDGVTIFNLAKVDALIIASDSSVLSSVYYENQSDTNPIVNPNAYQTTAPRTIYALVSNTHGCNSFVEINLQISNNTIANQSPISKCDDIDNQDGFSIFDLNQEATPQILAGLPSGLIVEFYLSENDAVLQNNPLPNTFSNTVANQQTIYARIVNGPDCYGITPIKLIVNTFEPNNFEDQTVYLCDGTPKTLAVSSNFSSYSWSNGDTDFSTEVTTAGNYTITVTNANGCFAIKKFNVINSGIATVTSIDIVDFSGNQNSVLINYSGSGVYEFSLDGTSFQDSPLFDNVSVGVYWVYIRDTYGCGTTLPIRISVLDYPRYFTPNGDGFHDTWSIPFLNFQPNSTVTIFDRYGKLIYNFQGNDSGWNGKLNAQDLPSTDYWFVVSLENGRIIKGNFSLIR
ncbi:choice-of-anchor L domain-containing protein [Flavobacterium sp.]|uniref:choice-of-anchor L domain-containing protein n=1 Tax=Flavobacterium sp. TaxID=239 RepID=UPI002B4AEE72|nr:choice-of-anchor L domain-containing protein [Flavobacterium sp.]HLF52018.1 choice-of-anchor L domain-containing protein [Flavobacterium sp.]